jgi:hypothetical protein
VSRHGLAINPDVSDLLNTLRIVNSCVDIVRKSIELLNTFEFEEYENSFDRKRVELCKDSVEEVIKWLRILSEEIERYQWAEKGY